MALVGIDIGKNNCKIAVRTGGRIQLISSRMPENMVDDDHQIVTPETMGDFIGTLRKEGGVRDRNCILTLAESEIFFRHVTLPPMNAEEVMLNLPYEFRDFISGDPSEYNYDFITDELVRGEDGEIERLELFAAAAEKKRVDAYEDILKKGGFRVKAVIPSQLAYARLIANYNKQVPEHDPEQDIILVDIGHADVVVSLLHGSHYEASRVIDFGCNEIDLAIADLHGIDPYTAGRYKYSNFEGVLDTPECQAVYDQLSIEINRVINYYNFDNPDKNIDQLYFLGGGAQIPQLTDAIRESLSIPAGFITDLMPPEAREDEFTPACALAIGALLEGEAM